MINEHFDALARTSHTYWWHRVRFNLISKLMEKYAPEGYSLVLDWGCGTGNFIDFIKNTGRGKCKELIGAEPSEYAAHILKSKNIFFIQTANPLEIDSTLCRSIDCVIMLDVLEHVQEPGLLLESLRKIVPEGTRLFLTVPAFNHLWSAWDERLGHKRRFTRSNLLGQLLFAGWQPQHIQYFFSGLYPMALIRRFLPFSTSEVEFPNVSPSANTLLTTLFTLESDMLSLPVGTSIAAACIS